MQPCWLLASQTDMQNTTYERVTNRILELMGKGVCPWRQPWSTKDIAPSNYSSGRTYNGINHLLLSSLGYEQPYFMTFRQVQEHDGRVIKGSQGCPIVYWSPTTKDAQPNATGETTPSKENPLSKEMYSLLRIYTVFNISQIEGIPAPAPTAQPIRSFEPVIKAEAIINGWKDGPAVRHGTAQARYIPSLDEIHLPNPENFYSPASYYCTRFHEMGHATGAPTRLSRKIDSRFGDKSYAKEELIAEMTSAFLCAVCGIDNHVIENQAAYLKAWTERLKAAPKLVVTAAGSAQRAANLIQGLTKEEPLRVTEVNPAQGATSSQRSNPLKENRDAPRHEQNRGRGMEIEI